MIKNQGFEKGIPDDWGTYSTGTKHIYRYPEPGRQCGSSAAIEYPVVETGKMAAWVQTISIDNKKKYKLSGWLKVEDIIGGGASIKADWKDANGRYLSTSTIMPRQIGTTVWRYFEGTVIPDNNAVNVTIVLDITDCSGKVLFDDISFSELPLVKKYKCVNGSCIDDPNGQYDTIEDCQKSLKYACIDNRCVIVCPDYTGTKYDTLEKCQAVCKQSNLIFEEHFDGNDLNYSVWNKVDEGSGLYQPRQVRVANSNLILRAEDTGSGVHSGFIHTRGKYNFKYGIIEFRAKYAHGDGARNQLWCQKDAPVNEYSMNIEDAVSISDYAPDNRKANESCTTLSGNTPSAGMGYKIVNTKDFWRDYHLFQMEWRPEHVIFKLDGVEQWRMTPPRVPDQPLDIHISLCAGKCGVHWGKDLNRSHLPFELLVDYVRIYKI